MSNPNTNPTADSPHTDSLTVDPDTLRTTARDLAAIAYRIAGLSEQVAALPSRQNLAVALTAAQIPAAVSAACQSWAAALAAHARRIEQLSHNSTHLASIFESTDADIGAAIATAAQPREAAAFEDRELAHGR